MALDKTALAALLKSKALDPANAALAANDGPALEALCRVFAEAMIEHFTGHAEVVPLVSPDPNAMFAGIDQVTGKAKIT